MTTIQIEAGDLQASVVDRTVTGLLLPFGETGRTNLGRVTVRPDAVTIPKDPAVVGYNDRHDHRRTLGRATDLRATAAGIVGTMSVANTPEGDELLAEVADTTRPRARRKLSAEVTDIVIRAGEIVSGRLFGVAAVEAGAFPSASLLAADAGDLPETTESKATTRETIVVDGIEYVRVTTTTETTETTPAEPEPEPDPAPEDTPSEDTTTEETADMTATATVPGDLPSTGHAPARTSPTFRQVVDLMARYHSHQGHTPDLSRVLGSPEVAGTGDLFAALNDIKYDGSNTVGVNLRQPGWLGELWSGRAYQRKYATLFGAIQPLTSLEAKGYKWGTKPRGGTWAGNKANVPTNTPTTVPYTNAASRWAMGHDHAREYVDFPSPEYWESYYRAGAEDYARWSDALALAGILAAATAVEVASADIPADVPEGLVKIVDGALSILDTGTPSFALVAPDLWRGLILTGKDGALEFLNTSLGLEDGTTEDFRILPGADLDPGSVVVGAAEAATFRELGETPIRVDALDMVKGGIDTGLFGYARLDTNEVAGIALVTTEVEGP